MVNNLLYNTNFKTGLIWPEVTLFKNKKKDDKDKNIDKEQTNKNEENKKNDNKYNAFLKISGEISLADNKDDADKVDAGVTKNTPELTAKAGADIELGIIKEKTGLKTGPYILTEFEGNLDYKNIKMKKSDPDDYRFVGDKFNGFLDLGWKLDFDFGKFKEHKVSFYLPFNVLYKINNTDDKILVSSEQKVIDVFSNIWFGVKPGFKLSLDMFSPFAKFIMENHNTLSGGPQWFNNKAESSFYFDETNIMKISVSPFDFIPKNAYVNDLWFSVRNKFFIGWDSVNVNFKNKFSLEIEYKGVKNLNLSWQPLIYQSALKLPGGSYDLAYDQLQRFAMGFGVGFENKNFEIGINYELPLWTLDKDKFNTNSANAHNIEAFIGLKY